MKSAIRVAILISVPMPPQEGIGTYAYCLASELRRAGHRPTVITRGGGVRTRTYEVDGVPVVALPFIPVYPFHVHLHGVVVRSYLGRAARDFDVVHAHSPLVPPIRGPWPIVTTLHSLMSSDASDTKVDDVRSALIRLQTPVSARLEHRLMRLSAAVAVVNPQLVDVVAARVPSEVPVRYLGNAVDTDRFVPGDARRVGNEVVAVGRLVHGKGLEDLIGAWGGVARMHPSARLTIVGEGPLRARLEDLVAKHSVTDSVRFTGPIGAGSRPDLVEVYRRASAVVQPSHHEGLSTVVLEAMSCSTPVIATSVGAHPTVIRDGVNGLLVPRGEPALLARAIDALLSNPHRAAEIGQRGRETVVAVFSWSRIARAYVALYEELLAGKCRAN